MSDLSRSTNVIKNTASGIVQRIVAIVIGFLIQVLYIRILGIDYVGVASLFASILSVLSLAELGIGSAITYNLYRPIAECDYKSMSAYVRFYAKAYRVVAYAVLLIGLGIAPFITYIIKDVPNVRENIYIIYLLILMDTVASYLLVYKSTVLIAAQRNRIVTNIQTIFCVVKCMLIATVLIFLKNYYWVLIVSIVVTVVQNLYISFCADRQFPELRRYKEKLEKEEVRSLFSNVRAMALYKVSGVVLNSADNIILSAKCGTKKVGILSNYNLVINNVYNLILQFYASVSSGVGNLATEGDEAHEYTIFQVLNFISFWIYGFCSVAILILAQPFIELFFGKDLLFGVPIVITLVVDFYIKGMNSPVHAFRNAHGLFTQGRYRPLVMAVLNIILSLILFECIGIIGIFLATILSRLLTQVWYDPWLVYRMVFKKKIGRYFIEYVKEVLILCFGGVVTYAVCLFIPLNNIVFILVVRALVCTIILNTIIFLLCRNSEPFMLTVRIVKELFGKVIRKREGENV